MEMNPAMEMDVPDGTKTKSVEVTTSVDANDQKFIDLAKKMKKLSPETLAMIEKDLQPAADVAEDPETPEDSDKADPETSEDADKADSECPCGKPDCKDCEVPSKDPRAMLIIGLKKVLSQA